MLDHSLEIGKCAAEPALSDIKLPAIPSGFLHRLLRLLFGANEQNAAAFENRVGQKVTRRFQSGERFAQVNDVDPVAGIEDEWFHLGVPSLGLMSKMDARFQ